MLLGEFKHNLDPKGRMAIPAKFRDKLTAGAIITRGIDNCLFVFANTEWETLAAKLIALPLAQANSRAFTRLMLAGASNVELDAQGRILIPDYLRKYAGLKKRSSLRDCITASRSGTTQRGPHIRRGPRVLPKRSPNS